MLINNYEKNLLEDFINANNVYLFRNYSSDEMIEDIIFSGRNTIVLWKDGTKTVTRPSEYDNFDPEVGVAMAIAEKLFGSRNKFVKKVDVATKKALIRKPTNKQRKKELRDNTVYL